MTNIITKNIINLTDNSSTASALSKFEELLETNGFANKSLCIVLGNLVLTHGHMARLKTLASNHNINIELIYTSAAQTQLAALNSGLIVSEKDPGDIILEEFKNSTNSELDQSYCENNQPTFNQEELNTNVEKLDNQDGIISTVEFSQETEFKSLNDVVEILNTNDQMIQQTIDLPFERKMDITHSITPTKTNEMTTLYIQQTLRSGQIVIHDGNVVIAGDTHPGSEIKASGDIVVWGTLGGIAHAGAGNNYKASIRALKMNAIQLRIADYIARRPDKNSSDFTKEITIKPEVARISNGEIRIFSLK